LPERKSALRAVEAGETAQPKKNLSILEATETGDRLEEARSMRRRIARTLDDEKTPARDLAALTKRHSELGREIDALLARNAQEDKDGENVSDGRFDAAAI
jgi:hypothetical protein